MNPHCRVLRRGAMLWAVLAAAGCADLDKLKKDVPELRKEVEEFQQKLSGIEAKCEAVRTDLKTVEASLRSEQAKLQERVAGLPIDEIRRDHDELKRQQEQLATRMKELHAEYQRINERVTVVQDTLQKDLALLAEQMSDYTYVTGASLVHLRETLGRHRDLVAQQHEELGRLLAQYDELAGDKSAFARRQAANALVTQADQHRREALADPANPDRAKLEKAKDLYLRALAADPSLSGTFINYSLGSVWHLLGCVDEARRAYEAFLKEAPADAPDRPKAEEALKKLTASPGETSHATSQ